MLSKKMMASLLAVTMLWLTLPLDAAAPAKSIAVVDKNSQTFIPLGVLKEFEGVHVKYDSNRKIIEITKENSIMTLQLEQSAAVVDGEKVAMNAKPYRDNGTVYVPLQFIGRHLDLEYERNHSTSSVSVTAPSKSVSLPVMTGKGITTSAKPITTARKTFKVGSRSISAQTVTISLLHPNVELDVVQAHNTKGRVEDLKSMAKRSKAVVAINGNFFAAYATTDYKPPFGFVFSGNRMLNDGQADRRTVFTFDHNHLAQLVAGLDFKTHYTNFPVKGAVQAGPRLLADGKVSLNVKKEGFKDPKILTGGGARSALGITRDHKLILLTTGGATIPQLAEMMKQAGAYQAMNLDGGASSGLYYNGSYLTVPGRQISTAIVVKLK